MKLICFLNFHVHLFSASEDAFFKMKSKLSEFRIRKET